MRKIVAGFYGSQISLKLYAPVLCSLGVKPIARLRLAQLPNVRFSTSATSHERLSWNEVKAKMAQFVDGCKGLVRDCKLALDLSSKENNGEVLSRKQLLLVRQTPKDVIKSLPLCFLFLIPLVGYVAPIVGFAFPKHALSHQFWTKEQLVQFAQQDIATRKSYYPQLRQLLLKTVPNDDSFETMEDLKKQKTVFDDDQIVGINKLSTEQLRIIVKSALLVRKEGLLVPVMPGTLMTYLLRKRSREIIEDDHLLVKEGINDLTHAELVGACLKRGIDCDYSSLNHLRSHLKLWLSHYQPEDSAASTTYTFYMPVVLCGDQKKR